MVRIGLTIYLMLVMLAGPVLCCCTTSRLVSPLFHREQSVQCHSEPPKSVPHGGCSCHHSHSPAKTDSQETQQPNRSPCDERPCPSKHHRSLPVVVLPCASEMVGLSQATGLFQQLIQTLNSVPTSAVLAFNGVAQALTRESLAFPYLTSQDILRALQILRC